MRSFLTTTFGLAALLGSQSVWAQDLVATSTVVSPAVEAPPAAEAPATEAPAADAPATDAPGDAPKIEAAADAPAAAPAAVEAPAPVIEAPKAEPVPEATAPKAQAGDKTGDKAGDKKATLVRNIAESGTSDARPWFISGGIELRMLAITDDDPANGRQMFYGFRAGYSILPGLTAQAALGLTQDFVAEEGESGFLFSDLQLLGNYNWQLPVQTPWFARDLALTHRFSLYLPTSRRSQANDVYLVPELLNRARVNIVDKLYFGADLVMRYQIPQYAEGAGPGAPALTQFLFAGTLALEYNVLESDQYGYVTVGIDASSLYRIRYKALDSSNQQRWKQAIGWSIYAVYAPLPFLAFTAAVTTSDEVLRFDGVETPVFGNRDTVQMIFNLTGRY